MKKSGDDVRNKLILARFGIMGLESLPLCCLCCCCSHLIFVVTLSFPDAKYQTIVQIWLSEKTNLTDFLERID